MAFGSDPLPARQPPPRDRRIALGVTIAVAAGIVAYVALMRRQPLQAPAAGPAAAEVTRPTEQRSAAGAEVRRTPIAADERALGDLHDTSSRPKSSSYVARGLGPLTAAEKLRVTRHLEESIAKHREGLLAIDETDVIRRAMIAAELDAQIHLRLAAISALTRGHYWLKRPNDAEPPVHRTQDFLLIGGLVRRDSKSADVVFSLPLAEYRDLRVARDRAIEAQELQRHARTSEFHAMPVEDRRCVIQRHLAAKARLVELRAEVAQAKAAADTFRVAAIQREIGALHAVMLPIGSRIDASRSTLRR